MCHSPIRHLLQRLAIVVFCALAAAPALADLGFPEAVKLPPQLVANPDQTLIRETLADAEFETNATGDARQAKRGQHYQRWLTWKPAPGEPAAGYYNGTEERIFNALSGTLTKAGWQQVFRSENRAQAVWKLAAGGRESWLRMNADAPQAQVSLELIEIGGAANLLVHAAPAAKPERFGDEAPFPYLTPWPGSTPNGSGRGSGGLDVTPAFAGKTEAPVAGDATMIRRYRGPATLSRLQFVRDNRDALLQAGWTVLFPDAAAQDAATIVARYTKDGRDLWARLDYEYGAALSYTVADAGGDDWAARLDRDCRVALNGVTFEFNEAKLRTESEPVLQRAVALLKARPAVAVEVQGHTDAVGSDDYNLKLSDARAATVRQWLGQHGIEAARLTSKGYGKTRPVADNGSDFGRARNRRVELVRSGCPR